MQEENLPLIPRNSAAENHDVEPVLRDVFQEILEKPKYPKNIAINISKYRVECEHLKEGAVNVQNIIQRSMLCTEDVGIVEEKILYRHAEYLLHYERIQMNNCMAEKMLLKKQPLFKAIDRPDSRRYGLIEGLDLLPDRFIKTMDFSLNENEHKCNPCSSGVCFLPSLNQGSTDSPKGKKKRQKPYRNVFSLSTDKVVFCNYSLNKTYKKLFKLQNVSNTVQLFCILYLPKNNCFTVELQKESNRVSPGMSATFIITFRTDNYLDIQDTIIVTSATDGQRNFDMQLAVLLASYRDAPNLFIYVYKNMFPIKCATTPFDMCRTIALNNSIDCGAAFITESNFTFLIVKNNGGIGKFFLMTEEDWFSYNINCLHNTLDLEVGCFTVSPAYFEIQNDEYFVITIEFRTRVTGVNLEKLVLLCNNATCERIDLIADGVTFDRYSIKIDESNLLSLDRLAYILFVPKEHAIEYRDFGEDALRAEYDIQIKALRNMLEPDYPEYTLPENSSSNTTTVANQTNQKSTSEVVLEYLKNTNQLDGAVPEGADYDKYHYQYLLFFKTVVPFKSATKHITIHNNCLVPLYYYWRVDDKGADTLGYDNLKDMDESCVKVSRTENQCLATYSTTQFDVTVTPNRTEEGFYRALLSLYIKSIPRCAIEYPKHFVKIKQQTGNLVDVLIATFDVVCRVGGVMIDFFPHEIYIKRPLYYNEIFEYTFLTKVLNEDKDLMECSWSINSPNLTVEPGTLVMRENEHVQFTLTVQNTSYYTTTDSVDLVVNNMYSKALPITIKAKRPCLSLTDNTLNFGSLQVGNKYHRKFIIRNENYISICWEMWENYNRELVANNIQIFVTNLEDNNIEVEYILEAKEEVEWESWLGIYTTFCDEKILDCVCNVTYRISNLEVYLHTSMSECPILCPKEILYIGADYRYTLCLHNLSNVGTYYYFGEPYGSKKDLVTVKIIPSVSYLEAKTAVQVNIEITPKAVGVMDDLHVPCYLRTCNPYLLGEEVPVKPIILTVLYVAEDIYFNVNLPINMFGIEEVITWPPQMIYDFDYEYVDYEHPASDDNEHETSSNSSLNAGTDNVIEGDKVNLVNDISNYLNSIMYPYATPPGEDQDVEVGVLPVPNNSQDTSKRTSDSAVNTLARESLRHNFGKELVVQENVIEFHDVPLRQLTKKTIVLQNCTPILGKINVELANFNPVNVKKKKIDGLLEKMNVKKCDDYDRMLPAEGVWIKTEHISDELMPHSTITIDILVYANTWGTYADELLIEVNDVLPLCITVLVEVVGLPLQFMNCMCGPHNYQLFRFGTISYKSDAVRRKIFFRNTSYIPISIVWHIFLKTKDANDQPITLIFDIFHPNLELKLSEHDSMGNLMLMHGKYFGKAEQHIFDIEPVESFVNAGDTKYIEITFDPRAYAASFKQRRVEAYLIGYIQVSTQFKLQQTLLTRKTGSQMRYLKMKLDATLVLPILHLELSSTDLKFIEYAATMLRSSVKPIKTLSFKNFHACDAVVTMFVDEPLMIESMSTQEAIATHNTAVVHPGEAVEVIISLNIDRELLKKVAETLYNVNYEPNIHSELDFETYSYKITRYLNIKQKGIIKQNIPIEIIAFFPYLDMTAELEYGFVFVGNNKKLILTIWNYSSCPVPFKLDCTGDLIIKPTSGTIEPAKFSGPSHIDVSVIFIPKMYKAYIETIILSSNVPGLVRTASVRGIGTHDEKHFSHDQC